MPSDLHQSLGSVQSLLELVGTIGRASNSGEIYQTAVDGLVSAKHADRAAVLIFEHDGMARFKAWVGLSEEYRPTIEAQPQAPLRALTAPIVISKTLQPALAELFVKEGIKECAAIPLLTNGRAMGGILLCYDEHHNLRTEELQPAQLIAAQVEFSAERQHIQAILREHDQRFRDLLTQIEAGFVEIDLGRRCLRVNDHFCQMLGYSEAELCAKTLDDIVPPGDRGQLDAGWAKLLQQPLLPPSTMEQRWLHKDGSDVFARVSLTLVRDENARPAYFIAVIEDITKKVKADASLRNGELLLLALSTGLGLWDCDLTQRTVGFSPQYSKYFGRPPRTYDEWRNLLHPDDRDRVLEMIRQCLTGTHAVEPCEFRVLLPDGTVRWLLTKATVLQDSEGHPVRILGVSLDITQRKDAEIALQQSEQLNKQILDIIPDCIFVLDATPDHRFRFVRLNPAEEKAVGYSNAEVAGKFVDDVLPQHVVANVTNHYRECLQVGEMIQYDDELQLPAGRRSFHTKLVPLRDAAGRMCRIVGCCSDLTELKRAQDEVLARQKLESMGVLAGGVAHDFNNLMGAILASSELALTESDIPSPVKEGLNAIRTAAVRGAEIVQQLMIYGGKNDPARESVDVGFLIQEMVALLKASISKHAVLDLRLPRNLPYVQANPAQIRQVVMNLVLNASEAIGEKEGVIRIATALSEISRTSETDVTQTPSPQYVQVEVSDTGPGMTPELKAKVFDPFFTTKFPGRGMGLAVVQAIVRDHRGAIEFVSNAGRGTTCLVWLPCEADARTETQKPTAVMTVQKVEPQPGTILVVEDEDLLRLAVSKALRKAGFSVIETHDGSAAMELLRTYPQRIDAILLDVTLPGISSRQIVEETARIRPESKVVLTSAYGKESIVSSFVGLKIDNFIRKPFGLSNLLTALRDTIADASADSK